MCPSHQAGLANGDRAPVPFTMQADDGANLVGRIWRSRSERCIMAVVHGYAEHSGRYEEHARRLNELGISVAAFDHRGHGLSDGRSGLIRSYRQIVRDTQVFLNEVGSVCCGLPIVLFGHSMGATMAGIAATERPAGIVGVVLSSPAIELPQPAWLQESSLRLERIVPSLPTIPLNRSFLSRRPQVELDTASDPLYYRGRIRMATGAQLIRASRRLLRDVIDLHLPLLILHGTADRITLPGGSRRLYRRAGTNDKALCLFPDAFHETFNDEHGERVWDRIVEFIDERLGSTGPTD